MIRALALAGALMLAGAPAAAAEPCIVDDATLTWGFKESFRSYISGTIANGEWTVADGATYETPYFGWSGGTGKFSDAVGTISFAGSITFTGHDGILNTTIANPQLRFGEGNTATLLLDVSGTTQAGEAVDLREVRFATIDLSTAAKPGEPFTIVDAPVELTADGAAAFGTYEAGEELDPISASMPTSAPCVPLDNPGAALAVTRVVIPAAVAVLVAGAVLLVVVLLARRKRSE